MKNFFRLDGLGRLDDAIGIRETFNRIHRTNATSPANRSNSEKSSSQRRLTNL